MNQQRGQQKRGGDFQSSSLQRKRSILKNVLKFFSTIGLLLSTSLTQAAPPNYDDDIYPIFDKSCLSCHNPDKKKGDLDLSSFSGAMSGSSGGKIATAGEGANSNLYGVITHSKEPVMPPEGKGSRLSKADSNLIRAWIDGGLLENKSGKPQKKKKPNPALSAPAPSEGKPDGPPPMPKELSIEPHLITPRASVIHDLCASPWAPVLAVTSQRQILLYHTDTLRLIGVLPYPEELGQPHSLSFHPSGKYLLAGGGVGGKSGSCICWEIETGKEIFRAGKDYDAILAASLRADLQGVSFGGPGKRVKLWNLPEDREEFSIKKHTDWITQIAYSPDGFLLASGGRGGGVYVWEAHSGNEFHSLRGHKGAITSVVWRGDSNLLATASEDGQVILWEMNNGKSVKKQTLNKSGIIAMDWHRDGLFVTAGRDQLVQVWKSDLGGLRKLPPFSKLVTEVAFSHDGQRIITADWEGQLLIWETKTGKQIGTLDANPPSVASRLSFTRELALGVAEEAESGQQKLAAAIAKVEMLALKTIDHRNKMNAAKRTFQQNEQKRNQANDKIKKIDQEIAKLQKQHREAVPEQQAAILSKINQEVAKKEAQVKIQQDLNKTFPELRKEELAQQKQIEPARKAHQKEAQHVEKIKKEFKPVFEKQKKLEAEHAYWVAMEVKSALVILRKELAIHDLQQTRRQKEILSLSASLQKTQDPGEIDQLAQALKTQRQAINKNGYDYIKNTQAYEVRTKELKKIEAQAKGEG